MQLIEESGVFSVLLDRLRTEPLLAVDTEAASFHRHRDRVYLLQLSTRSETWLIDPLSVASLTGFGELLADPGIEFVFHDADYDLRLLGLEFDVRVTRLFDTRVAAQFLNEPAIGLAALLHKYLGVQIDKQFQRADWSIRPLTTPMLRYAAMDTAHLPALRDILHAKLRERGRLSWVEEECELLTRVRWPEPELPAVQALSVKGTSTFSARSLAIFRELYVWRARVAESLDRAAFRIVGNEALLAMAAAPPKDLAGLSRIRGVGRELIGRNGTELLAAIGKAEALPETELPRRARPPRHRPDPLYEKRLERLKDLRVQLAAKFELAPGLMCPNWLLESIARATPVDETSLAQVPGIRRWQLEQFGMDLLAVLHK